MQRTAAATSAMRMIMMTMMMIMRMMIMTMMRRMIMMKILYDSPSTSTLTVRLITMTDSSIADDDALTSDTIDVQHLAS